MAKGKDKFTQVAYIDVTESAANTLTFNGLSVFSNILTPQGLLIHRVEYNVTPASVQAFTTLADGMRIGLCGSDQITAITLDDARVYDFHQMVVQDFGVAGTGVMVDFPWVADFSTLPGGGRLVPADRIYCYLQGINLGGAIAAECRFHFTLIDLDSSEYLDLAQSLRVLT